MAPNQKYLKCEEAYNLTHSQEIHKKQTANEKDIKLMVMEGDLTQASIHIIQMMDYGTVHLKPIYTD